MTRNKQETTLSDILAEHSPNIRALTGTLQQIIKQTVPDAIEKTYPVWRGIGYRHPQAGYVCGIFPQKDCVKVGFEHGVLLDDPQEILSGEGKQVRYLIVTDKQKIPMDELRMFLLQAIGLPLPNRPRGKATKRKV